jgi:hypothetical protein
VGLATLRVTHAISTCTLRLTLAGLQVPQYEHHIFISYRHFDRYWVKWTRDNLALPLTSLLRPALGNVDTFIDEQIETGASWPQSLAQNLSRSRLMVAVLSRPYFESRWCRIELALMHHREKANKFRTSKNPAGLIIPLIIDDGDHFPTKVTEMQGEKIHEFANPFIRIDSPKQEALAEVLRTKVCPAIEKALRKVPEYNPSWEKIAHKKFENMFRIEARTQKAVPTLRLRKGL